MANRGACQFCNEDRVLNDRGLCTSCRHVVPCHEHPDLLTEKRCRTCRKPKCDFCIQGDECESCQADAVDSKEKAREKARAEASAKGTPEEAAAKRKLLGLACLLVGTVAFNIWYFLPEPETPDMVARQELKIVRGLIAKYVTAHGEPPKSISDLALVAKEKGVALPVLVPALARPIPNVISYKYDGKRYELSATNEAGALYVVKGKPLTVKVP